MKTVKIILGVLLWIIVVFSAVYLYKFSEAKDSFISIFTRTDSSFYKNALEEYKMNKADYYWHYTKTKDSYFFTKTFDSSTFKNKKSYSILDSLKKNNSINLNSIITLLPQRIDTQNIVYNEIAWIGKETKNSKIKQLYKTWLIRTYEKAWINEIKNDRIDRRSIYLDRIKDNAIGVRLYALDLPEMYLRQEIDINKDQNKFSITTHYFGRDTLTVTKNYRITTPPGEKIKPFDYEEIE